MAQAVKFPEEFYEEAKAHAQVAERSIPKQIQFWAKIGKAALENPDLPVTFIYDIMIAQNEESVEANLDEL